jgi:hypothetical protein
VKTGENRYFYFVVGITMYRESTWAKTTPPGSTPGCEITGPVVSLVVFVWWLVLYLKVAEVWLGSSERLEMPA